jgi:uncharacterized protein YbjT (DUF2867 family)
MVVSMTTLVLCGTGKTGRRVAERLAARGRPVRVGSRAGEPPFDWEARDTWRPALESVDAVYVAYYPDLAFPGAAGAVGSFVELAGECGVRRLVLLSRRGEEGAMDVERAVREARADWTTIVRAAWLAQCFSEGHLRGPVRAGEVALPAVQVEEPFVDAADVADVAVAALTEDGHGGRVHEVTGPRLLTFAEAVDELAEATGRRIAFRSISIDEYTALLTEQRVPVVFATLFTYLFSEVLDGRNAHLGDGVRRALGREPRDFADYAREAAATGAWGVSPGARE